MQRILSRCPGRHFSFIQGGHPRPERGSSNNLYYPYRGISGGSSLKGTRGPPLSFKPALRKHPIPSPTSQFGGNNKLTTPESKIQVRDVATFFKNTVEGWAKLPKVRRRLEAFGIPPDDMIILLTKFVNEVQSGRLSADEDYDKYNLKRLADSFPEGSKSEHVDRMFTNVFYTWASDPNTQVLETLVPSSTLSDIRRLYAAADLSYPADQFHYARAMRRKVIMHVGPTNSGKTHTALRALASAKVGLYAGPLRLLAHEIWERLNKGQIVPLDRDPEPDAEPDKNIGVDVMDECDSRAGTGPTLRKNGSIKYARPCNLLTGEEQKIVMEGAPLLSCTVEMVSTVSEFDVAVVDEIQMIADPERGGAWTNAVLGLCAKELHLCGEETAVPLIEALIKDTGDDLVVQRYQRLTPLTVQDESLDGDLGRVRKGDCVVTFSRSNIFALKRRVEELTGLRCAVAYGRLPPELRSEQAALFNDPESAYDVMVGSDAIGMGLNL